PPSPHRYSTTLPPPPSPTPFPTRRSSDLPDPGNIGVVPPTNKYLLGDDLQMARNIRVSVGIDHAFTPRVRLGMNYAHVNGSRVRSEEHMSELQSRFDLVCRLLLEKKNEAR